MCVPLCERKHGLLGRLGNDAQLVAANRIKDAARLGHRLGTHEAQIDAVDDIRHGRVEHDRTWNSLSTKALVCAQALARRAALCHTDPHALAMRFDGGEDRLHHDARVSVRQNHLDKSEARTDSSLINGSSRCVMRSRQCGTVLCANSSAVSRRLLLCA